MHKPLTMMQPDESAVITSMDGAAETMLHLLELGLAPGERIRLIRSAPLGDPMEIELMGYRLAIRRSEASRISVRGEGKIVHAG